MASSSRPWRSSSYQKKSSAHRRAQQTRKNFVDRGNCTLTEEVYRELSQTLHRDLTEPTPIRQIRGASEYFIRQTHLMDIVEHLAFQVHPYSRDKERKKTLVLATGGTFGSFPDENGRLAPVPGRIVPALKAAFPQSQDKFHFLELQPLIDSTASTFFHWNYLAIILWTLVVGPSSAFDSAVVLHGTDTLADTASALSFMFWNTTRTIILTGSQHPFCHPVPDSEGIYPINELSDAWENFTLACAMARFAYYKPDRTIDRLLFPGVFVAFRNKVMIGTRVIKAHSTDQDAFDSPNHVPLARIITSATTVEMDEELFWIARMELGSRNFFRSRCAVRYDHITEISKRTQRRDSTSELYFVLPSVKLDIIHLAPSIYHAEWQSARTQDSKVQFVRARWNGYHGIIVNAYGSGNVPDHLQEILLLARKHLGIMVIILTKCPKGSVAPDTYATGANQAFWMFQDGTHHAAYAKAACMLSISLTNHKGDTWLQKNMERSIRGELSQTTK